ncbi:MAG: WecB/TagA/CpsF family glycosyltransferase [Acaryochloridaceae cyanobacterium SU_2_1]|nr:WecB/TagA/CpsF family glycosyltransferase [Acaryochloridaceae cyanobacterium SU_2_1]
MLALPRSTLSPSQLAVDPQGFELWYQPVYEFASGQVLHNEVLLRWRDQGGKLQRPKQFMPLIIQAQASQWLDRYVIEQTISQLRQRPELKLSINLSSSIIQDRFIAENIYDLLEQEQVHPHQLNFEISEISLAQNFDNAVSLVHDLKDLGCTVMLDDFANRYLTFLQWEKLELDAIKLDASLIQNLGGDCSQLRLVQSIIDASSDLGQRAIAKSVDGYFTSRQLFNLSFKSAQGYHFKPPSNQPWLKGKVEILGVAIDNLTQAELLHDLTSGIIFTPNVDHLMNLRHDSDFHQAYDIADYKICDSQILYFSSHILGSPLQEKISGSDLFPAFYHHHKDNPDIKIFLLGAAPGIAAQAQKNINTAIGREIVVGSYSPSFDFDQNCQESAEIIERIRRSGATVLAIGVGSPKQERWIHHYREQLLDSIKIIFAIGGTLDFEAGAKKRAPQLISNLGIEWLFRLASEPRRLWKRYLINDLPFLWLMLNQKLQD